MSEGDEEMSDKEFLAAVMQPIALSFGINPGNKPKGKLYFLTETMCGELYLNNGSATSNYVEREDFPAGISEFVSRSIDDPSCVGLVPLCEKALDAMEKHGLNPKFQMGQDIYAFHK